MRRSRPQAVQLFCRWIFRAPRQPVPDIVTVIGSYPFQAANCNGFVFDAPAAASGLAGTIANTPQYRGKNIGFPVAHVGIRKLALCDHSDIARNVCVCRAGPLTVDNFVEIFRLGGIGWLHLSGDQTGLRLCYPDISAIQHPIFRVG